MSNNLVIFNKGGALRTCSFLFISLIIFSLFFIPFSSAIEIRKDPISGVIINPFTVGGGTNQYTNITVSGNGSSYNSSYHAIMLSTAVFNATYNDSYHAMVLSTAKFNTTYNATYHAYNSSTGLIEYYVPYTGAIKDVDIGMYNFTTNRSISFGTEGPTTSRRTLMYFTSDGNLSTASDGFKIQYDYNYELANDDWLLFIKTDGNDAMPDGGIAFIMENESKHNRTVLKLDGYGLANFSGRIWVGENITAQGNITADWFFGKINFSDIQNNVFAYNMSDGSYNVSYHNLLLSTATFNTTYNASYEALIQSTNVFNSTYNITYHNIALSTATFNSTYNGSYVTYNATGNINLTGNNITGVDYLNPSGRNLYIGGNVTAENITVKEYLMGQPITGMLGSGIIEAIGTGSYVSGINVTCAGLTCSYEGFRVRLASTTSAAPAKYCNISAGNVVAPDNSFTAYYVDSNCAIQQTTYDDWFGTKVGKIQAWDIFYILSHKGDVEVVDSISLEQKRLAKLRVLNYYKWQSTIISGFNFKAQTWPQFNITSGKTVFGMDIVSINEKNSSGDGIELVGHNQSSTTWQFEDKTGLNVTSCDNGTDVVACTGNNWRRHFIFHIGYDDSATNNVAELHQLFPLQSITYTSLSNCLDTVTYPLQFSMPAEYTGANVMLYAYCAKRTDTTWITTSLIDLRTVKTGTATSATDTTNFVPYTGASNNVVLGNYNISASTAIISINLNMSGGNITQVSYINPYGSQLNSKGNFSTTANITADWFFGKFNMTTENAYIFFNGTTITFNESLTSAFNSTYNISYHNLLLSTVVFNSTYNESYHNLLLSTAVFNTTYNSSYEALIQSTNVFNSTYNITYHNIALSTADFNSTLNNSYVKYNNTGNINITNYTLSNIGVASWQNGTGANLWRMYVNGSGAFITEYTG